MRADAPIIMASVTIFALISYIVMPEESWLPRNRISHFIDSKGAVDSRVEETVEEIPGRENEQAESSAAASKGDGQGR